MDQPSTAKKAQKEAEASDSDVFSDPGSLSPHHRPGHSGVQGHHRSHRHDVPHHHGGPHHHVALQDFRDCPSPRQPPPHRHTHHHGGAHHPTPLALAGSRGALLSRRPHAEDFLADEHRQGSRRPESRPHAQSEPYPQGGSHSHSGPHHQSDVFHYSGLPPEGEPYHHKEAHSNSEVYDQGGPHHGDADDRGRHHHHQGHHHRRPLHHGETHSHHSFHAGSSHQGVPCDPSEHHRSHHGHHGEHHRRERPHGAGHHDALRSEHYVESRHAGSWVFGLRRSSSPETLEPRRAPTQGVLDGLTESPDAGHPHASRVSNKVHPQDSCSKTSGSWAEEEQFQKRKTIRAQRAHRKLHNWLWENICHLFHGLRKMLRNLTDSLVFDAFIFLVVCLNTIMLVAQTFAEVEIRGEWYFIAFDSIFLSIYVVEAMLKIIAMGLDYFCDAWNNLDFVIMITAVVDFTLMQFNSRSFKRTIYNQKVFRVFKVSKSLRALRAIRVLRRLSFLTSLQEVTGTLVRSLPSITAILVLMFTCLFLFSVVLRALFRQSDPKRFQNIFTTIFTLFTLLTLDDWSQIYLDSWDQGAWYIIPILMIYIIIQYFIFLNLVIAVLVDNFQMALLRGLEKVKQERAARIQEPLLCESLTELDKAEPKEVMSEHTKQKRLIEKKFGTMTEKQQELVFHFLQLVAGVEHYQQKFRSQASVIDEIVDTAFETGEEDFRK